MKAKVNLGDSVYRIFSNYPYNVIKGTVIAIYSIKYLKNKREVVYSYDIDWEGLGEEKQVSDKLFSLNPIEEIDKRLSELKMDAKNYGLQLNHCNYTINQLREERKKYKPVKKNDNYDAVGVGFGRSVDADGNISDTGFGRACDAYGNLL